jgi:sugar phosphate isomerase/epimerase
MRSHSTELSRRDFLLQAAAAASCLLIAAERRADANTVRKSRTSAVGLQLYTVAQSLEKNFESTLQSIHRIGYGQVEAAGALHRSAAQWRKSLNNVGLHCASAHLLGDDPIPAMMDFAKEIGAAYVVTALYMLNPTPDGAAYRRMIASLTLDDYKRMAEQCNRLGEQAKQRDLQLAYHNENIEFEPKAGSTGYKTLLAETDARLVKLELDCGWMVAAGHDPVEYLLAHPGRYRMLHVKDFKPIAKPTYGLAEGDSPESAQLGRGTIDYLPIVKAARRAGIEYYYVEEEPPFVTPVLQALEIDYKYTKAILAS